MSLFSQPRSRQEILRKQQQSVFIGREEQVTAFRSNLTLPPETWCFLFNIYGQGGVGKTTLLRRLRQIAEDSHYLTSSVAETEMSVPEVMGRLTEQLEQRGHKLSQFSDRYKVYRQKKQELEADPELPQGFSTFLGRSLAKAGLGLAKQVPGSGAITPFVDEEAIATQASQWASYVAKKLGNKDEVRLVQEPVEVLTPLFLQDLNKIAEKANLVLFFDTYERTSDFLDPWFREILEERYGDLPINAIFIIAGRDELDKDAWADYESAIARFSLQPFTDDEIKHYLARKGITEPQVINVIRQLSGGLPLLVATLAAESPSRPDQIGDPSGTAVERFLKWVDDPNRRQVALNMALTIIFNRDVLAALQGNDQADELFDWLRQMPFVVECRNGWIYHDVVRAQMLRYKRLTSPQNWNVLHDKLVTYYAEQRDEVGLGNARQFGNQTWGLVTLQLLYHRLCQTHQSLLPTEIEEFLEIFRQNGSFALAWSEFIFAAGKDAEKPSLKEFGALLVKGCKATLQERSEDTLEMLSTLINFPNLPPHSQALALGFRGERYRLLHQYEAALKDLDRAIAIDPDYAWAIGSRGQVHVSLAQFDKAIADFDHAITLESRDGWIFAHRAKLHESMNQLDAAIADFDQAVQLSPRTAWMIAERGEVHQKRGNHLAAIADFDRAINLDSELIWVWVCRGQSYLALGNLEQALEDLNLVLQQKPEYGFALAVRGIAYRKLSRYEDSLADLNSALQAGFTKSQVFSELGETYLSINHYEDALQIYDQAIEDTPNNANFLAKRGEVYRLMKSYEVALQDFDRAISINAEYAWAVASRGQTYSALKRNEEAIADFNRAIQLNDQIPWFFASRAQVHQRLECYDKALADFGTAIGLEPNDAWSIARRAGIYYETEKYTEALAEVNRALEIKPNLDWAVHGRGLTFHRLQQYENAIADFNQAIHLNPDLANAVASRGYTRLLLHQFEASLRDFNTVISPDSENDWDWYGRALAHQALGQLVQAKDDYERAIQIAHLKYDGNSNNWMNLFNLALYHLGTGSIEQAELYYHDALTRNASQFAIRAAIRDLEELTIVFSGHQQAARMTDILLQTLASVGQSSAKNL